MTSSLSHSLTRKQPGATDDRGIDIGALAECLDRLDEQKRNCIVLAFVEGYSHEQLAERLAAPLGTVKSWIRRGLLALKECLA